MNTEFLLSALVSYFVIVDPVGTSLIFNALTSGKDKEFRRKIAFRAVMLSGAITLLFGFFGVELLKRLDISMDSFRIAGGLLLFYTAFNMMTKKQLFEDDGKDADAAADIAVFPMSFPLIAGPGCLTLTILLFSKAAESTAFILPCVLAVLIVFAGTYLCMISAGTLSRIIGTAGSSILNRLLGVLLAAFAIQFVVNGIKGLF